jgi:retron-type reverse transcriptase
MENFEFYRLRKIEISKETKEKNFLDMDILRNKIIQKALALILETIYESLFSNCSFYSLSEKGVHFTLKELYTKGGSYL